MRRRRWGKLLALVLIAGVGGTVLGVGIAALSGGGDDTATTPSPSATPDTSASAPGRLRLQVLGAVLHPAGTELGQRRRRARVTVRIQADNRTGRAVVPDRPALLVSGERVETDDTADSPRTHIDNVPAGETVAVTLRFETAGDVTTTITRERRARLSLGGQTRSISVTIGDPVSVSDEAAAAGSP